ncbi:MAG TPA: type I glyceraldehyde-3-phosphate dehydrogenase [Candidatus Polarisedimenticolia bacterium]|nr:type I glyceraldehyde-3-phosphate dehydrogenase [Candidatus Polarisedimenticolia bacterium]
MKRARVAVNGFGRIGRLALRAGLGRQDMEFAAINDLYDPDLLVYLFRHDSVHGRFAGEARLEKRDGASLSAGGQTIPFLNRKDPASLPWKDLGVDVVLECSGAFRSRAAAGKHLEAGARKVVISAPSDDADVTVVMGVNAGQYDPSRHHVLSNASCTTNALAPVAMVLDRVLGIERGFALTVHAYTSSQALVDLPQRKRRRSRAAALNLAPTSTGAAAAVGRVLPGLAGRLDGLAVRSPNADGSLLDLTALVKRRTVPAEVNHLLKTAAEGELKGILRFAEEDGLVSSDIIGDPHSCIVDGPLTMAGETMVKVMAWYDNEHGYACRLLDAAALAVSEG